MIRISRYFENRFSDSEISDDELRSFAADSLARLTANNVGFDNIITSIDTALTAFQGSVTSEEVARAVRQSRTITTNAVMAEIKGKWNQREGKIRDAFGKGSPEYVEFYPQGITEYGSAQMDDMLTLLQRYVAPATAHVAVLGQPFLNEWTGFTSRWTTVRGAQVAQKGTVAAQIGSSDSLRTALEMALGQAVLTVALAHFGHPEVAAQYFNQSLLENPASPAPPTAPVNPQP